MKCLNISILFISLISVCFAQEWKANIAYNYMYAPAWDKAIQVHNFSRPFLDIKQPLLMHGMQASIARMFQSNRNIHHGLQFAYAQFRSEAQTSAYKNGLHLHFLKTGYIFQFKPISKNNKFYAEVHVALLGSTLFRRLKNRSQNERKLNFNALGIGGEINVQTGYYILNTPGYILSIFLNIGYTPFLFSPDTEAVLNQTKGLVSAPYTSIFNAQSGVAFHFCRRKNT
jgi:hypothetical protein